MNLKITIEAPSEGQEDEIIIRCSSVDDDIMSLIMRIKNGKNRLAGYSDDGMEMIGIRDIYYFEAVDNRVFAYCEKKVLEVKMKLYEIEREFGGVDFVRISKSVVVNISCIERLAPMFGGKLEARLKNGESVMISRQYVSTLKAVLGI